MNADRTLTERIDALEADDTTIRRAVAPAAKAAYTERELDEVRRRFDFNGINIAPAAVVQQAALELEGKYDHDLEKSIEDNDQGIANLEHDADATIEQAAEIPIDPTISSPHTTDQVRLLGRIASSLERADAERRLTGKTPREALAIYNRTPDTELARVIEEQARTGWRDVPLAHNEADAGGLMDLKTAVDARRLARAKTHAADAFEVKARIAKLKSSAVREMVSRMVRVKR